jgi:hypothetical protein
MATKHTVSRIMANLRELHPELPERARVNLELDLRRMATVAKARANGHGDHKTEGSKLADPPDAGSRATATISKRLI